MAKRKFKVGDKVIGNEKKASFRDRKGTIVGHESGSQYWVAFDDGRKECVNSSWIDKRTQDGHSRSFGCNNIAGREERTVQACT